LTATSKLAGVVGLSSYLLMGDKAQGLIPETRLNAQTPFFMGHGDSDPLVKYEWGQKTAQKLKEFGFQVDFRTYK
jgi:predicted esterase